MDISGLYDRDISRPYIHWYTVSAHTIAIWADVGFPNKHIVAHAIAIWADQRFPNNPLRPIRWHYGPIKDSLIDTFGLYDIYMGRL